MGFYQTDESWDAVSPKMLVDLQTVVVIFRTRKNVTRHDQLLLPGSLYRRLFIAQSFNLSPDQYFGVSKEVLDTLAVSFPSTSPKSLKEFPWEKAKSMVLERFIFLGKNVFKWSFITWFVTTFVIDISLAVSRNTEVMIPLGLFIGVTLADFMKEMTREFFQSSIKDTSFTKTHLGIASFFMLVKFISSCLNMQGQTLLSHIGNGGLMQILWLAKQQTESNGNQEECTSDATASSFME